MKKIKVNKLNKLKKIVNKINNLVIFKCKYQVIFQKLVKNQELSYNRIQFNVNLTNLCKFNKKI